MAMWATRLSRQFGTQAQSTADKSVPLNDSTSGLARTANLHYLIWYRSSIFNPKVDPRLAFLRTLVTGKEWYGVLLPELLQ